MSGFIRSRSRFPLLALLLALLLAVALPARATSLGLTIDLSDPAPPASGTGWTYAGGTYTINNGGTVIVIGSNAATGACLDVAANALGVIIVLTNASITAACTSGLSPIKLESGAYVILQPDDGSTNTLTASGNYNAGINVPAGATLTIGYGTGTLNVTGSGTGVTGGAGIGGNNGQGAGTITINEGTVIATGAAESAGIGGGWGGGGGSITITGGSVTAQGGNEGAGIGGGEGAGTNTTSVTITGGTVNATGGGGGFGGAGIGGGYNNGPNTVVNITGGTVTAQGGSSAAGIGGGGDGSGVSGYGSGGTITIGGTATVNATGGSALYYGGGAGIGGGGGVTSGINGGDSGNITISGSATVTATGGNGGTGGTVTGSGGAGIGSGGAGGNPGIVAGAVGTISIATTGTVTPTAGTGNSPGGDGAPIGAGGSYGSNGAPTALHTITATVGANGSITPAGASWTVSDGGSLSLTITPAMGYVVASVQVDGGAVSTVPAAGGSYDFSNVTGDHSIAVTFALPSTAISSVALTGNAPVTGATAGAAYSSTTAGVTVVAGSAVWSPTLAAGGVFAQGTEYTLTLRVTPDTGYALASGLAVSLNGLPATSVTSTGIAAMVTFTFPRTLITSVTLTGPAPVAGAMPVATYAASTANVTVSGATWSPALPASGEFEEGTAYTLTLTLTPDAGYTLGGTGLLAATLGGVPADVTVNGNVATLKFTFPPTLKASNGAATAVPTLAQWTLALLALLLAGGAALRLRRGE